MKKETLEEVSKHYANMHQDVSTELGKYLVKVVFQDCAKCKQEKSKQNRLIADEVGQFQFSKPKMYSEEDIKSAYEQGARLALLSQSPLALHKGEFPNPEEWFNDFKKK